MTISGSSALSMLKRAHFKKAFDSVAHNDYWLNCSPSELQGIYGGGLGVTSPVGTNVLLSIIVYLTHFLLSLVSPKEASSGHFCF